MHDKTSRAAAILFTRALLGIIFLMQAMARYLPTPGQLFSGRHTHDTSFGKKWHFFG
jgi:hypothetical protein